MKKMWWKKKKDEIDIFGNKFELCNRGSDGIIRITQTNRSTQFHVSGNVYSRDILRQNSCVKTYYKDYHYEARLERDIYGRLILYFYDEEMNFNGNDRVDYLWLFVEDESDADRMAQVGKLARLRVPFISGDETDWMSVHERVN